MGRVFETSALVDAIKQVCDDDNSNVMLLLLLVYIQVVVQKLFESVKPKDELTTWCETVLRGVETSVDR